MTLDPEKLLNKRQFIRDAVRRLEEIRAHGREAFLTDQILQAAALRNLQVAIEAMIDAASHIIAREGLGIPRRYRDTMDLLVEHGILPAEHKATFGRMTSFRNRIVHLYEEIDPEEVADILEHRLGDFEIFLTALAKRYFPSS